MDVENDHYFKQWVRSRNIKDSSTKIYLKHLKPYCQYTGLNPTKLIQEAREDQINMPWISDRRINNYLLDYTDHTKKYSYNYQKNNLTIIKSFYHHYEIQLPKIVLKNRDKKDETRIPTPNDIKLALENCSIKYQSIILLMASSGMGKAEIRNLTIKDLKTALNYTGDIGEITTILDRKADELIGTWHIQRKRTDMPYTTFNSPESTRTIIKYLHRCRQDPHEDEPLFTSQQKNQISDNAFTSQFRFINDRCKFGWCGNYRFFTSHQLRRFFGTTLIKHRIPEIYADWFLGHTINPVQNAYFKADTGALKNEYLKVLPYLTIREKVRIDLITDERVKELEERLKVLEQQRNDEERYKKLP